MCTFSLGELNAKMNILHVLNTKVNIQSMLKIKVNILFKYGDEASEHGLPLLGPAKGRQKWLTTLINWSL